MECIAAKADFTVEYTANNMDFFFIMLYSRQREKRTLFYSVMQRSD